MTNKKMAIGMLITQIGALYAYLIGSGFASGQEIVQYFAGWGSTAATLLVGIVTLIMIFSTCMGYAYAGSSRGLKDINSISEFYGGKIVGKLLVAFAWIFTTCCYFFMISGFGSTLNQQWGVPVWAGCALAVILSVGTTLCGLKNVINVIGIIGPLVVIFTLIIGVVAAFSLYPQVPAGNAAVAAGEVQVTLAGGGNPIMAALSFGGCCVLLPAAYVGTLGYSLRDYKRKYVTLIVGAGTIGYPLCCLLLAFCHVGNIQESSVCPIPNLLLASQVFGAASGVLSILFAIIILLAIYSTICPLLWSSVSTVIKDEKSAKYRIACIGVGIVVYFICILVPYQTLLNYIMTYCGYTGVIVFAVVASRYLYVRHKDRQKELSEASGQS